ncbi:MAG: ORF6N domain-containing protein [Euryarchaeota archaeon]|nr:ORF6N domain-containing protein [Euryarchaeota archaeon]
MDGSELPVPEEIQSRINTIHGVQVMLDEDLAGFCGVEVKRLNEEVKRDIERFPEEFMFQLSAREYGLLRPQNAAIEPRRGQDRKYLPYAFTEPGLAMLSAVLRSESAERFVFSKMDVGTVEMLTWLEGMK